MSLLLYTSVESACAQKVRLVLSEKQLVWEEKLLNLRRGDQFLPDYLALNPKAVVPTLVHGGRVIRESSIINEYLDEVFPKPPLKPLDSAERSQMRLWVKTVDDEVHPAIGVLTYAIVLRQQMNELKTPQQLEQHFEAVVDPKRRERQQHTHELGIESPAVAVALAQLKQVIGQMDEALAINDWLVGDEYSLADAAYAPYMMRLQYLNLGQLWQETSQFDDWLSRIQKKVAQLQLKDPWGSQGFIELVKRHALSSENQIRCFST